MIWHLFSVTKHLETVCRPERNMIAHALLPLRSLMSLLSLWFLTSARRCDCDALARF